MENTPWVSLLWWVPISGGCAYVLPYLDLLETQRYNRGFFFRSNKRTSLEWGWERFEQLSTAWVTGMYVYVEYMSFRRGRIWPFPAPSACVEISVGGGHIFSCPLPPKHSSALRSCSPGQLARPPIGGHADQSIWDETTSNQGTFSPFPQRGIAW